MVELMNVSELHVIWVVRWWTTCIQLTSVLTDNSKPYQFQTFIQVLVLFLVFLSKLYPGIIVSEDRSESREARAPKVYRLDKASRKAFNTILQLLSWGLRIRRQWIRSLSVKFEWATNFEFASNTQNYLSFNHSSFRKAFGTFWSFLTTCHANQIFRSRNRRIDIVSGLIPKLIAATQVACLPSN